MINHDKKYIFIHIPKTGGSSIEQLLLKVDGIEIKNKRLRSYPESIRRKYNIGSYGGNQHYPISKFEITSQENYFCFTFVRNPYSRILSEYKWQKSELGKSFKNFKQFLKTGTYVPWHRESQCEFINENIDFIARFENFQRDVDIICDKIGIPQQQLPHKNKTEHKHYTEYYDDETREIVAERYAKDIEYFGYEFGE